MKRNVPRFNNSVIKTSAAEFVFLLAIVLQFISGSSTQTEGNLSVYFHFNQRIKNRPIDSSICIGPFSSDVNRICDFYDRWDRMGCFKCYPQGCHNAINYLDITNLLAGEYRPSIEDVRDLKRSPTNRTLFVNLEVKCTFLKAYLDWYVKFCEDYRWLNDETPRCPADTITPTTKTTTTNPITRTTTSSTKSPINSLSNFPRAPFPSVTSTSTRYWQKNNSATDFVEQKPATPANTITTKTTTKTTTTNPITSTTTTPLYGQTTRQTNNSAAATEFGKQMPNQSSLDNQILWISLGATATVFTLTVFFIIFCQRAKIAKFLRRSENPDVVDDAFCYTDVSMGRRDNQSESVTYENVTPNLLLKELNYIELEFNVQKNSNPLENAAAEINSTTLNQKRDIKGYVDSVIYAELRK